MKNAKLLTILALSLFLLTSCSNEEAFTPPEPQATIKTLPAVKSTKPINKNILAELVGTGSLENAKEAQKYNIAEAVITKYEGEAYKDIDYVYMPYSDNPKKVAVFMYYQGVFLEDFGMSITQEGNNMVVESSEGEGKVTYITDGTKITNIIVDSYIEGERNEKLAPNGKSNPFRTYMDCGEEIGRQAAQYTCGGCPFVEYVAGIACGTYGPCTWAAIVACTAYAIAEYYPAAFERGYPAHNEARERNNKAKGKDKSKIE